MTRSLFESPSAGDCTPRSFTQSEDGVPRSPLPGERGRLLPPTQRSLTGRRTVTVRRRASKGLAGLVLLLALGLAPFALAAVKPKPWMWTAQQASHRLIQENPQVLGRLTHGRFQTTICSPRGNGSDHRYVAFVCQAGYMEHEYGSPERLRVFLKVRRAGTGLVCASTTGFAAIPSGCLSTRGTRVLVPIEQTQAALGAYFASPGGLYQGPMSCVGYGAGFFRCTFGSDGIAEITFLTIGPTVKIVRSST